MKIDVRDSSTFLSKRKLPNGFDQIGSIYLSEDKGLLLYHRKSKTFKALVSGKVEELESTKVLVLLGIAYLRNGFRAMASRGGSAGDPKKKKQSAEHYAKMQEKARLWRELQEFKKKKPVHKKDPFDTEWVRQSRWARKIT